MRKNLLVVALSACVVLSVARSLVLAADNWLGEWKLNVSESKYSPGPAPKSQTLRFEATKDGSIKLSSHTVEADGKSRDGSYVSKFDGQDVPWKGNPDADTSSAWRIDENTYENTWKKNGKVTITAKVTVSPDGKTLTITRNGTDSKGRTVSETAVYTKQ
jgi:hypothetical protein